MTTLAHLARQIGVNERTLRRAVNRGTLRGERRSPHRLELALSERSYIQRNWPLLATLQQALRTENNVRLAVLFGSQATGEAESDSDIDLLVDLRDSGIERLADLEQKLSKASERRVDLVRLADATSNPLLVANVIHQGRPLVDRDERWKSLSRKSASLDAAEKPEVDKAREALSGIDQFMAGRRG